LASACGLEVSVPVDGAVREQIALEGLYDGYIRRQERLIEQHRRLDEMRIPPGIRPGELPGISFESREKFARVQPTTVGQASRIPGVRPSDIALLIGHIRACRV
jgi:tRNA uridine 5-carboxymethylaminomethyl modification enzyme